MKISLSTLAERLDLSYDDIKLLKSKFGTRFELTTKRFSDIIDALFEINSLRGYSPFEILDKFSDYFTKKEFAKMSKLNDKLFDQHGIYHLDAALARARADYVKDHLMQSFPYIKKALHRKHHV